MPDFEAANFFTDASLIDDPLPYLRALRAKCPVVREPHYGLSFSDSMSKGVEHDAMPNRRVADLVLSRKRRRDAVGARGGAGLGANIGARKQSIGSDWSRTR